MRVEVWFDKASQPVVFENATGTYEKGSYTCVASREPEEVHKYPTDHIFCLVESKYAMSRPKEEK